jgi:hypothetical protein
MIYKYIHPPTYTPHTQTQILERPKNLKIRRVKKRDFNKLLCNLNVYTYIRGLATLDFISILYM